MGNAMKRSVHTLIAATVLSATMIVAGAPEASAQDGGCMNGQDQAFVNALGKNDDPDQALKHLLKMIDCTLDQPPGEGQP
jgi:hypothetical protein